MTPSHVTVITVTFHTGDPLRECLAALMQDTAITQIIVVDNGNPPDMQAWLAGFAREHDKVQLVTPGRNLGFGAAVNLAAGQVRDGYLFLVNPDAIIAPGAASKLVNATTGGKRPCIAGGRIHDAVGQECRGTRRRKLTLLRAATTFLGWNTWTLEDTPEPASAVKMDAVSGALMLLDMESFRQLQGFDEAYFLHVEDVDLCRRAWEAGGDVIYCPQAGALHYGATSDVASRVVAGYKADSLAYYFQKHATSRIIRSLVRWLVAPLLRHVLLFRARN